MYPYFKPEALSTFVVRSTPLTGVGKNAIIAATRAGYRAKCIPTHRPRQLRKAFLPMSVKGLTFSGFSWAI